MNTVTELSPITANQHSSRTKQKVIASIAGQAWYAVLGLIAVPIYIRLMGIEAYGLVGFFVTLQTLLNVFDFGLSPAITRALAQHTGDLEARRENRNLVRTFEVVYWSVGLVIGGCLLGASHAIATRWIHGVTLAPDVLVRSISLMSIAITFQWPLSLYQGGLYGLGEQVSLNLLMACMNTLRTVGAVLVLYLVAPRIDVYFAWQILVNAVQIASTIWMLWRRLPVEQHRAQPRWDILQKHQKFAASMGATSVLGLVLRQSDRVILSRVLDLTAFGYYNLAVTLANTISMVANPIFSALFPRFVALTDGFHEAELRVLYHQACQLVSVAVLPATVLGVAFSGELLHLWTGNESIARLVGPIFSVLLVGTACNALAGIPYDVQVARGWTKLGLVQNACGVVILVPTIYILASRFGPIGAAWGWVIYNAASLLIAIPLTHHRALEGELEAWAVSDIGIPALTTLAVVVVCRIVEPTSMNRLVSVAVMGLSSFAALGMCVLAAPYARSGARTLLTSAFR